MTQSPTCNRCGDDLTDLNWRIYTKENNTYLCNKCIKEKNRLWAERSRIRKGLSTMKENRMCSSFLGVHVAEEVLNNVFKNVERMPYGNSGFDFVCGSGYLVDSKSSCTRIRKGGYSFWQFHIKRNIIAEYFVLLAFDNRNDTNPLHIWMIPGHVINDRENVSISESTIDKWDEYRLDIDKVITCCDAMKEGNI